jgi:single-strand DNA-binding protein
VATNETWTDSKGAKQVRTEWHRIAVFGPHAENAAKYLKKGSMVDVEGRLQTSKWTDKNGIDRYTTEIVANSVQYLSPQSATA